MPHAATFSREDAPADLAQSELFQSNGWHCELVARPVGASFQSVAICRSGTAEAVHLPEDAAPYATTAEALRHARQQAMRYASHH
jgi:hypothetical protein